MAISGTLVLDSVNAFLNFCPRDNFGKEPSIRDMGDQKLWTHHT